MTYTVALGDAPHSRLVRNAAGPDFEFPRITPVHKAFAPMVRELKYDFSELAIATYLQAREAGKAITLLPVVLNGDFHHHSIVRPSGSEEIGPRDLIGKRVGVRAYSQTTGLWVRGVLKEEFGVESGDITWVTTEGAHVAEYVEPPYVERTSSALTDLLRDGDIAAAVLGPNAVGEGMIPVIPDTDKAEEAWFERHHTVPVNHMLTVRTEVLRRDPGAVLRLYRAFAEAIDQGAQRAVTYGVEEPLVTSIALAIEYGREQDLLRQPVTVREIFAEFQDLI